MKAGRLVGCCLFFLLASAVWLVPSKASDDATPASVEERRLRIEIQQELAQVRAKAESLRQKEMELKSLQEEVDKKLNALSKVREQLDQQLAQKDEAQLQKVRELAKMYEKMDPATAAEVLANLDHDLAIGILGGIKSKAAGKILANMEKDQAVRLSKNYANLGLEEK